MAVASPVPQIGDSRTLDREVPWATFQYTKADVNKAGRTIRLSGEAPVFELERAVNVINNWRSSHNFPLNTFHVTLRRRAEDISESSLTAQRLKRLSSIALKLRLLPTMNLFQMQDIGGCRAVLPSMRQVQDLVESYTTGDLKHKLVHLDDYTKSPRSSGYRSVHLIYRYRSDRTPTYDGFQVELQIRSQLQHAWATAVETVGTLRQQAFKSSLGDANWLRFFALMGSALALRERTGLVPGTPTTPSALVEELRGLVEQLDVDGHLKAVGAVFEHITKPKVRDARYFLLELDPVAHVVNITSYEQRELAQASSDYAQAEKKVAGTAGADAVLVSVDSISALRRAYPNYFLDTDLFMDAVRKAISA